MLQRSSTKRRQEADKQQAKEKELAEKAALDAEKKREKRRQKRISNKEAKKNKQDDQKVEEKPIDLMQQLQELRKEMGGPFLNKEENMKLKSDQRKQRKIYEKSDMEIMELR